MIDSSYLVGLTKQVFITDYLLNGLFPCQSDIVRLIRGKKREWKFNDKFEYRMLLANTNTGGSLNSQTFKENVGLINPGQLDYGVFHATYGTVSDGFDIDMMVNLETKEKQAAFESDYAMRMHSLRNNVAALFKNFAIHGRYGVVHQLRGAIDTQMTNQSTPLPIVNNVRTVPGSPSNTWADVSTTDASGNYVRVPFTIAVPINVFNSNFKKGKYLIKTKNAGTGTTAPAPWDPADIKELYMVVDNQPNYLTLVAVGTAVSDWNEGEFLEVFGNRAAPASVNFASQWSGTIKYTWGGNSKETTLWSHSSSAQYTYGSGAVTGAMEGLADLFPWYASTFTYSTNFKKGDRLGLDLPFRGQPNRNEYTTEQSGGFIFQNDTESIIDCIMRGVWLTKSTVPYAEVGVWMNPVTRLRMGYEEGSNVTVLRDNFVEGPIVYQRGVKSTDYQIGNQVVKEVVEDLNMPTDVIIVGPKNDISYNCWDNATFEIDKYIQDTWSKSTPPKIEELAIPNELIAKMDLTKRITFGSPTLSDGGSANFANGGASFVHPKNVVPVAMHEMGALFTEYPYTYTVIKLQSPIVNLNYHN